jgi:hypothetical protein
LANNNNDSQFVKAQSSGYSTTMAIEIGPERAPFVVFVYFFPHLNMQKNLLIMGLDNTKNSSRSVISSYLTLNNIGRILLLL